MAPLLDWLRLVLVSKLAPPTPALPEDPRAQRELLERLQGRAKALERSCEHLLRERDEAIDRAASVALERASLQEQLEEVDAESVALAESIARIEGLVAP